MKIKRTKYSKKIYCIFRTFSKRYYSLIELLQFIIIILYFWLKKLRMFSVIELRNVTSHNKWMQLDVRFHDNTNSSPEAECCCSSSLSRYSNFRQGPTWRSRSGIPLSSPSPLPLEEQFDRDLFPGLLAARTRARRERLSFYFPFIAAGGQRVGDDVISSGEGSRELKPRVRSASHRSGMQTFAEFFFYNGGAWSNNARSYARKKSCAKKARVFFIGNIGKFLNKFNSNSFYLHSHLYFILQILYTNSFNNTDL